MFRTPGNNNFDWLPDVNRMVENQGQGFPGGNSHSSIVDDNYMVIGAHLEQSIQEKIVNNEYVDFSKLLVKDKISTKDGRMELVSRGGATYFVPASDKDASCNITGFGRWEQAFRIFSNVYTRAYPWKSLELIQYNHIIYTASLSFSWENVYLYDKEFRMHLS